MWRVALALPCVIGLACKRTPAADPAGGSGTPPRAEDPCAKARPHGALAWIADDYPAALACGRQRDLPVVVDLWAPWCHTCLSMQTTVFADPSLAAEQARFVFVALDTDREANAPALTGLSISAWPTFYVLAPDEAVLARFVGAASLAQFRTFLDSGARARKGGHDAAAARMLGAERALAKLDYATAEEELVAALAAAPATWPRRPEAISSLILTRSRRGDHAGCLDAAERYLDDTGDTAVATDATATALGCATQLAEADAARVQRFRERAVPRLAMLADAEAGPMSTDDRSDAFMYLRQVLDALGDSAKARTIALRQRAMLDEAAAKAPSPLAAMTFNWPRAEVYAYLGVPLELVAALEQSVADLPAEYDPPARLGWIYLKAGRLDDAARWTERALALVYGPRKGRLLAQRAEIAAAAGDRAAERSYRELAVQLWESLPEGQQSPANLERARQALAALDEQVGAAPTR
jgi:thioredoxin-like negative regulator of GroEL